MYKIKGIKDNITKDNISILVGKEFTHKSTKIGKCIVSSFEIHDKSVFIFLKCSTRTFKMPFEQLSTYLLEIDKVEVKRPTFIRKGLEKSNLYDTSRKLRLRTLNKEEKNYSIYNYLKKEREVKKLTHITHIDNLKSILDYGLFSRSTLQRKHIKFTSIDDFTPNRQDNAIPLWIAHVNHYNIKQYEDKHNLVIINLDLKVISHYTTQYFKHNHHSIEFKNPEYNGVTLSSLGMCKELFKKEVKIMKTTPNYADFESVTDSYVRYRTIKRKKETKRNHPTSTQSEVLVFENIDWSYIKSIQFLDNKHEKDYKYLNALGISLIKRGNKDYDVVES